MPRNRLLFSDALNETMQICALRFDGYQWLETMRSDGELNFAQWTVPLVDNLTFHEDETANFATFFALQRFLGKWGGEMLPLSAPEHTAFCFLFLHLHPLPVPAGFAFADYESRWRDIDRATIAAHASTVRLALLSPRLARGFGLKGRLSPPDN